MNKKQSHTFYRVQTPHILLKHKSLDIASVGVPELVLKVLIWVQCWFISNFIVSNFIWFKWLCTQIFYPFLCPTFFQGNQFTHFHMLDLHCWFSTYPVAMNQPWLTQVSLSIWTPVPLLQVPSVCQGCQTLASSALLFECNVPSHVFN